MDNFQNFSQHIIKRPVRIWLLTGLVMVFFQVLIGGVTRLTDSGLSITEWAVIQGTIPPTNEAEWREAFDMYKVAAKKQYESLHADMSLSDFKFIYFWEYFHRLWARLMGFVFLFPFLFFLWKKWLPGWLLKRLGIVILLAVFAAVFGWIMVKSGLNNDNRTWVSAYKLIVHLGIAATLFGYLFWTWLKAIQPVSVDGSYDRLRRFGWTIAAVLFVQIIFGGLMAGMRAGLLHPHLSVFIEAERFWNALAGMPEAGIGEIVNYEPNSFVKAVVQLLHRSTAWILAGLILLFFFSVSKKPVSGRLKRGTSWMTGMLIIQIILGLLTVINSIGRIPVLWGVIHQAGALLLLIGLLYVNYQLRTRKIN